jgi:nucleosome binding factor SPN SPT16 subunit
MTEGVKSPKDTLFFLTPDSEEEEDKKSKKPPIAPLKNGSPVKQKTVGGKVLRNQTRRAVQDDVHQTALVRLVEHQRELHQILQSQGLAKFSEDGGGSSGKEGKGWKKFQSYKGEGALPSEVEKLRVGFFSSFSWFCSNGRRSSLTAKRKPSCFQSMALLFPSTLTR